MLARDLHALRERSHQRGSLPHPSLILEVLEANLLSSLLPPPSKLSIRHVRVVVHYFVPLDFAALALHAQWALASALEAAAHLRARCNKLHLQMLR